VPGTTVLAIFTVHVDVPDPVTVGGLKGLAGQVNPASCGGNNVVLQPRVTTPLNPLMLVTVTERETDDEPKFTVAGATVTEKS
jgi:hypothetical protein